MPFSIKQELLLAISVFEEAGINYAVCGGVAVAIYGYARATRDVDFLLREEDLEKALRALEPAGYDLPSGIIPFNIGKPNAMKLFRVSKIEGEDIMTLDLMLVTPFLQEVWERREEYEFVGRRVWVVSKEGLAKMKQSAGRKQDLLDLEQLGLLEGEEG